MLDDNRTRYWSFTVRSSAELAIVVLGILLALAADDWWANRQDRAEEQRMLVLLRAEFETNLSLIDRELNYRRAVVSSILTLFDAITGQIELEGEKLDKLIGDVTWWGQAEYSTGALEGILQGGRLSLIENEELRNLLAGLPGQYESAVRLELEDQETARTVIYPFLSTNASFAQIANTMESGQPGTGSTPTPPVYPVMERQDHRFLLSNTEFAGILIREHWDHQDGISGYQSLQAALQKGINLIDEGLGEFSGR